MFTLTINSNSTKEEFQKVIDIINGLMGESEGQPLQPIKVGDVFIAPDDERDSSGLLWDARIHSSSRSKNQNGTWKIRRGATAEEVQSVRAELMVQSSAPMMVNKSALTADVNTSLGEHVRQPLPDIVAPSAYVPPVPTPGQVFGSTPPAPPAPPTPGAVIQWPEVLRRTVSGKARGVVDDAKITSFLHAHAIDNMALLATRSDLYVSFLEHCGI